MKASEYQSLIEKPAKKGRFPRAPKADRTLGGIVFDSKREMLRWADLQRLEQAGEINTLERQKSYPVEINGYHFCKFTPDFSYHTKEGRVVFEDVKSSGTAKDTAYRLRKKSFELYYGVVVKETGK